MQLHLCGTCISEISHQVGETSDSKQGKTAVRYTHDCETDLLTKAALYATGGSRADNGAYQSCRVVAIVYAMYVQTLLVVPKILICILSPSSPGK